MWYKLQFGLEIVKVLNIHTFAFVKEISASHETEVQRDVQQKVVKTLKHLV